MSQNLRNQPKTVQKPVVDLVLGGWYHITKSAKALKTLSFQGFLASMSSQMRRMASANTSSLPVQPYRIAVR